MTEYKPDNFKLQNSLKLIFRNISGLHSNFVECECFFESNSHGIFALCETNLDDLIDSFNFSVRGYLSLVQKDSATHVMCISLIRLTRYHFFLFCQQSKSEFKVKFGQASYHCKRVLEAANFVYGTKTKESITPQKLDSQDFWRIANNVLNKGKSAISPLFSSLQELSSASNNAQLCAKNFSKNSNLDDSSIYFPVFPSRTNLKLHNISVTPKMVKKVISNLDSAKVSGPDCIPEVVLKNCEPEFLYILAELFNMCLKESCFPGCWKVSLVVPVFKNAGEMSTAENYLPSFLWLVKSLKNL